MPQPPQPPPRPPAGGGGPRPRRSDIQAQIDQLTQQLEAADDDTGADVEVWIKDERGRETRLTGQHAKKWLKNLGLEDDEPDPGEGEDEDPDPPPGGGDGSIWGRRGR